MADIAFIALVTVAIGIGYLLGRRSLKKTAAGSFPLSLNKTYFQGLNYLLNEQPDKAVDAFVESLDVNANTLETHLALGKLMRKQGQVDRAIRIHQNLLARPQLDVADQHQVHLELARDFMAAGLLDRAEILLKEVIAESTDLRGIAQRYLLDIFQDEREWSDAIQVAEALVSSRYVKSAPDKRRTLVQMISHFYCELAEEANQKNDSAMARKNLDKALLSDKTSIRAALLMGALENQDGRHKQAIKVLSRAITQNPSLMSECLPELYKAYVAVDPIGGFNQALNFVESQVAQHPSITALLFMVDQLLIRAESEPSRQQQAHDLLSRYLQDRPSLAGLNKVISLQIPSLSPDVASDVISLQSLVQRLIEKRLNYQCTSCGFAGRQLHWRCPSCKSWDQMEHVKAVEAS
jgi:lipopolysaccharide biosynthesis regulator YciM